MHCCALNCDCSHVHSFMNLQNRTAPGLSMCTEAVLALYGSNDTCANAVRQLLSNETDLSIFSIPGCQERLNNVGLYCNFDTSNNITEGNNRSSTSISVSNTFYLRRNNVCS